MLVLTRKIFQGEKRGRDTPLINTSGAETGPRFCHCVIVAGLERIEIQYFLRRKTKHLYKRLVLVFSLREGHCISIAAWARWLLDPQGIMTVLYDPGHSSFLVERCLQPFSDSWLWWDKAMSTQGAQKPEGSGLGNVPGLTSPAPYCLANLDLHTSGV